MKKVCLFVIFNVCVLITLNAQSKATVEHGQETLLSFKIDFPDTSNHTLFRSHPNIEQFSVLYREGKPYMLFMFFNQFDNGETNTEHYDLAFEGDAYLLTYKYGPFNFLVPKINAQYGKRKQQTVYDEIDALVTKDSIRYHFVTDTDVDEYDKERVLGGPAKYQGSLKELEASLAKMFAVTEHHATLDSILVFQGTVGKLAENKIYDMKLIAGKTSSFSRLIQTEIAQKTNWSPAMIDRGPIETKIRIFARLNPDGSITIKTPRRLRTLTGE